MVSTPDFTGPEPAQDLSRSSVKLTLNSKREVQLEVKVRVGDSEADVNEARRLAVATFNALRGEYGGGAA